MTRTWRGSLLLAAFVAFTTVLATPTDAEARRGGVGLLFINWGEELFETGPVPAPYTEDLTAYKSGYKCSIVGLFWAYFYWWGCEPVLLENDETYILDTPEEVLEVIRKEYTESDIKMGFWTKHGRWIFLGALVLFVGLGVLKSKGRSVDQEEDFAPPPPQT